MIQGEPTLFCISGLESFLISSSPFGLTFTPAFVIFNSLQDEFLSFFVLQFRNRAPDKESDKQACCSRRYAKIVSLQTVRS